MGLGQFESAVIPWIATTLLVVGVAFDLRTKKYPNKVFLASTAVATLIVLIVHGFAGLLSASLGFLMGLCILLPLALAKVVGAGDMKLLAAFGILAGPQAAVMTAVWGLAWATVFGLLRIALSGQSKIFAHNMLAIVMFKADRKSLELHTMPLTVGLLLGWLSHWLVLPGVGL